MSHKNHKLAFDPQELSELIVERANRGDVEGMILHQIFLLFRMADFTSK